MRDNIDWSSYAALYDLMADNNPAYQEILTLFSNFVDSYVMHRGTLLDAGAGTGNFSIMAARLRPLVQVLHLEPDQEMNRRAKLKAQSQQLFNWRCIAEPLQLTSFQDGSIDALVCVHVLYTLQNVQEELVRMSKQLRPGGIAFLCNFGRSMRVQDWRSYFFRELRKTHGLRHAISLLWRGRRIAFHNARIARLQKDGTYWVHSADQFRTAVESAGFCVLQQKKVYRGYSDLIIASLRSQKISCGAPD